MCSQWGKRKPTSWRGRPRKSTIWSARRPRPQSRRGGRRTRTWRRCAASWNASHAGEEWTIESAFYDGTIMSESSRVFVFFFNGPPPNHFKPTKEPPNVGVFGVGEWTWWKFGFPPLYSCGAGPCPHKLGAQLRKWTVSNWLIAIAQANKMY